MQTYIGAEGNRARRLGSGEVRSAGAGVRVAGWVSQGVLAKQAMGFTIPTDEIAYDCAGFLI